MMPPPKLVVDASVGIKWYVAEPGSTQALALIQQSVALSSPDLLIIELDNILWKKVQRDWLSIDEAQVLAGLAALPRMVTLYPANALLVNAVQLALRYRCTVYDCLYRALALAEDCPLITADERFFNALRGTPLEPLLRLLTEACPPRTAQQRGNRGAAPPLSGVGIPQVT